MNPELMFEIMTEDVDFRFLKEDNELPEENFIFDAVLHAEEIEGLDEC